MNGAGWYFGTLNLFSPVSHFPLFLLPNSSGLGDHSLWERHMAGEKAGYGNLRSQGKEICWQRSVLKRKICQQWNFLWTEKRLKVPRAEDPYGLPHSIMWGFGVCQRQPEGGEVGARAGQGHTNRADDASPDTCASWGPKGPLLQGPGSFQTTLLTLMSGKGAAHGRMRLRQPIRQSGGSQIQKLNSEK